jgi:two-component system response regulator (stage 0 sporulation protein A)
MIDILIADDDAVQTEQLSNVLSKEEDFRVLKIAKDGIEALNDYMKLKPTVFILDLDMPKMNGLEVIEKLSEDSIFDSKTNIIVLSGSALFRSQISNPQKIKWIFTKPFINEDLIKEIREIYNEEYLKENLDSDLNSLFIKLDINPYTKGSTYLKNAISIAFYDIDNINITRIAKQIACTNGISNSNCIQSAMDKAVNSYLFDNVKDLELKTIFLGDRITTKDFISKAIYYINNNKTGVA